MFDVELKERQSTSDPVSAQHLYRGGVRVTVWLMLMLT